MFTYLLRHWRGQLGLGISFWVNFLLVNFGLGILGAIAMREMAYDPRFSSRFYLAVMAASAPIYIWQVVGVVRSARRTIKAQEHTAEQKVGGAYLAIAVMIISVLVTGSQTMEKWPGYKEYYAIAFKPDPLSNYQLAVTDDGTRIRITGMIGFGSGSAFEAYLNAHPGVTGIILDSLGGRISEGHHLARLIKARHLDTFVSSSCNSSCTVAFAAGAHRMIADGAYLGFHRYFNTFSTIANRASLELQEKNDQTYFKDQGVDAKFVADMYKTETSNAWMPAPKDMIAAGLVQKVLPLEAVLKPDDKATDTRIMASRRIEDMPVFKAMKRFDLASFQAAMGAIHATLARGTHLSELQAVMEAQVGAVAISALAYTDDKALLTWAQNQTEMLHLLEPHPKACIQTLYPSRFGATNLAELLPLKLLNGLQTSLGDVIIRADRSHAPVIDQAGLQTDIRKVVGTLGDRAKYLAPAQLASLDDFANHCGALTTMYSEIVKLPPAEATNVLRGLFLRVAAQRQAAQTPDQASGAK